MSGPIRLGVVAAWCVLAAAACGAPDDVVTDRADSRSARADETAATSTVPASTLPATAPTSPTPTPVPSHRERVPADAPDDVPVDSADDPHTGPHPASVSTGVGDPLFVDLGAAAIDVLHYDVELELDDLDRIEGEVMLDIRLTTSATAIALDALDLDIESVTVDGSSVDFRLDGPELIVELPEPAAVDTRLAVRVAYMDEESLYWSPTGFELGWYTDTGGLFVLSEPDGARSWLPSNDHPSDRATWTIELVVPEGTTAIANGELRSGAPTSAGATTRWVWDAVDPMPTYLVQVIVGDYRLERMEPYRSVSGADVRIEHAVPVASVLDVEALDAMMREQLAFYESLLGPYPASSYGLAFLQRGVPGLAMETQGRSQFTAGDFVGEETSGFAHAITSHEAAHHWFGNAVSPARWDDIWLNEGLTTYAEWLWLDHTATTPMATSAQRGVERLGAAAAWAGTGPGAPDAQSMFSELTYDGGGAAAHALRLQLGDETFFDVLRSWVQDNVGAARSVEDFVEHAAGIAQAHGVDVDVQQWAADWLFSATPPAAYPQ